jgi:hypothetical protein
MPSAAPQTRIESRELPIAGRECEVRNFARAADDAPADAPLATAEIVFSAGASVRRYDWYRERFYNEVLEVTPKAVRLDRIKRGISLLDTHDSWRLASVLGICDQPVIEGGQARCRVTFSRRDDVAGYVQDVADGVIRHVSTGYVRHRVLMEPPAKEGGDWTYRVTEWEPHENSLVPIPADMDSQVVRSGGPQRPAGAPAGAELRTFACVFEELMPTAGERAETETRKDFTMPGDTNLQGGARSTADDQQQQRTAPTQAELDAQRAADLQTERQRAADITALCQRHGMADQASAFITKGSTIDAVRTAILDKLATRSDEAGGATRNSTSSIQTVADEVEVRQAGIAEALLARIDPKAKLSDNGRQFRGMTLLEMGRDYLEFRGKNTRGMGRLELAGQILQHRSGMMSTSDFASLLQNVANKRLRQAYDENMGTYARWARRAPNAPDFKSMSVVQLGAAPDLLRTNEHGEFTYGAMTDGKETYSLLTYGRIVALTRQALVNDDLRGFDRLVGAFGASANRLENRTVYAILTANAALADTGALFNSTAVTTAGGHANLAGAGGAISVTTLSAARAAMRLQKGLQSEELNIVPAFLIAPAAIEQVAYQYTSANYVPATASAINEFRAGGRTAVEPIIEPILDANSATAWYLAASNSQVDTVEYCYLEGAEGPVMESQVGFEVDGVAWKCRLDFAAKAIDFRGLYKNPGA